MAPKEPTRAQLSSRLAYQCQKPSFLLKLENRMKGIVDDDDEEYDEEFEHIVDGREPVPRRPRPSIPERPEGDAGSEDDELGDEKPQVVVLKEGKHLTEREAENIRRKEKGLSPLPDVVESSSNTPTFAKDEKIADSNTKSKSGSSQGLSFSSSSTAKFRSSKRKATSQLDELKLAATETGSRKQEDTRSKNPSKKAKKENKTLLSFGDDA